MILPEDDKDSVRRMIQWLYSRKLGLKRPVSDETSDECYMQLAKLNTLADKYDIYLLKNDIVDELFHLQKPPRDFKPPPTSVVAYIYNNTTRTSSFRKLMVAWYAHLIDFEWYGSDATRDWLAEVCHDFAIDLVLALGTKEKYPDRSSPFTLPTSVFHEMPPKKVDEGHA